MKNGFFDSMNGDRSSSRLSGFIVIAVALIFAQEVLYFGRADIISAAIGAGTIFATIAGPAMLFLYATKHEEAKHEEVKQELETPATPITLITSPTPPTP